MFEQLKHEYPEIYLVCVGAGGSFGVFATTEFLYVVLGGIQTPTLDMLPILPALLWLAWHMAACYVASCTTRTRL